MRETSIAAHESIKHRKPSDKNRILGLLRYQDMTCHLLESYLNMLHQTCSARLSDLYEEGKIIENGEMDGETVWTLAPEGTPPRIRHRCATCGHKL